MATPQETPETLIVMVRAAVLASMMNCSEIQKPINAEAMMSTCDIIIAKCSIYELEQIVADVVYKYPGDLEKAVPIIQELTGILERCEQPGSQAVHHQSPSMN